MSEITAKRGPSAVIRAGESFIGIKRAVCFLVGAGCNKKEERINRRFLCDLLCDLCAGRQTDRADTDRTEDTMYVSSFKKKKKRGVTPCFY